MKLLCKLRAFCTFVAVPSILITTGCAGGVLPFPLDERSPLPPLSNEERCFARKALAEFDASQRPPRGMLGGLLLDGTARAKQYLVNEMQVVSIDVEKVLLGEDQLSSSTLTVISPTAEKGGISFNVGRRYRIFAVPQGGKYYTWAGTGTFELGQATNALESCPK
jgi:hypothetical protein